MFIWNMSSFIMLFGTNPNLGDVETQNIKVMKISYKHMPKCAKIYLVMVSSICGIASQGVQTMKHNRFYSEKKFTKQDASCQNDLVMCFYRIPYYYYTVGKLVLVQTVHSNTNSWTKCGWLLESIGRVQ